MVEQLVIIDSGHADYTAVIHASDSSSKFYVTTGSNTNSRMCGNTFGN
ncbi:MAG: hypothetical protein NTU99_04385 [Pseudanabaena sp. LacPavin_0818_WC45_MAG_42_6]|nr:hypothetical protein [Pseudanabaena sp. LacPavin_0818_WC45_MAG_42_6]